MAGAHRDDDPDLGRLGAALEALGVSAGPPDACATVDERRAWLAAALLGAAQAESMQADGGRLTRRARHATYEGQLDVGAGPDDAARLGLVRWQVRRATGPLPALARASGADPIPLAAAQAAEGLQILLAVASATPGAVAAGDVDVLAAQAAKLRAARTALRAAADNTDVLLEMLSSVGL